MLGLLYLFLFILLKWEGLKGEPENQGNKTFIIRVVREVSPRTDFLVSELSPQLNDVVNLSAFALLIKEQNSC